MIKYLMLFPVLLVCVYPKWYKKILNVVINSPILYAMQYIITNSTKKAHSIMGRLNIYDCHQRKVLITPVSCSFDNYAYLIVDLEKNIAVAVDPVDPEKVLIKLEEIGKNIKLTHLLLTHKHWDHAGGNKSLVESFPDLIVVGSKQDFPKSGVLNGYFTRVNKRVKDQDIVMAGRLCFKVLMAPCHTMGSVMYLLEMDNIKNRDFDSSFSGDGDQILDLDAPSLFTGDTIFTGGVGKFFEGDATDMHLIIKKLLLELGDNTLIWPGHEYTLSNLEFAVLLEPNNAALQVRLKHAKESRSIEMSTVPSTWKYELMTNPFLRIDSRTRDDELWLSIIKEARSQGINLREEISTSFQQGQERPKDAEEIAMLDCLRSLKDNWKPNKNY